MKKIFVYVVSLALTIGLVYQGYLLVTMEEKSVEVSPQTTENTLSTPIETPLVDKPIETTEPSPVSGEVEILGDVELLDPQCYTVIDRIIAFHSATGTEEPGQRMDELIGKGENSTDHIEWPPGEFEGFKGIQIFFEKNEYPNQPNRWDVFWTVRFNSDNTWFFYFTFDNRDNGEYLTTYPFDWRMFQMSSERRER